MSSDERAILDLLGRYCELQDAADMREVSALFAHATYRSLDGPSCSGADEVYALKTHHDQVHADGTLRTQHVTTNTIVDVAPDRCNATTRSYFTVLQATEGLPFQVVIAGRYHDTFEKAGDQWRFTDRLIISDLVGDLSRHIRDSPLR